MYKIVFALQTMVLGGVEKELLTLLRRIDYTKFDVTVLLMYIQDKEIVKEIPMNVKVVNLNIDKKYYCSGIKDICIQRIKNKKYLEAVRIVYKRIVGEGMTHTNTDISSIKILDDFFDVAICYHMHSPLMLRYVSEKVKASKKIAWIHNDFIMTGYPVQKLERYLEVYDKVIGVSRKVADEFRTLCEFYKGQVAVAHNILDSEDIKIKSMAHVNDVSYVNEKRIKILTIGRFTEQKGIEFALEATKELKQKKLDFHWYLIGYGKLENKYKKIISEYEINESFTILGKKDNPYPYIKMCDIYVQPSIHEAFGLVVKEAKILNKPIVCTDFVGADEQIEDGVNGHIVPVGNTDSLVSKLEYLILHTEERERLSSLINIENDEKDFQHIINLIISE